jgi:CYTH domain-containing protein
MNVAPHHSRSFPIALVRQRDGALLELREQDRDILLVVERDRTVQGSTKISPEQAALLGSFREPYSVGRAAEEIERKWRPVKAEHLEALSLVESRATKVSHIQQGYLCLDEDEARLRRKGDLFFLTLKSSGALSRREVEVALSPMQFEDLWSLTEGQRLEKTRSVVELSQPNGLLARVEIDRFRGCHSPLVLIECEFASLSDAAAFQAPPYFGDEVTSDPHFKNRALASPNFSTVSLASADLPRVRIPGS